MAKNVSEGEIQVVDRGICVHVPSRRGPDFHRPQSQITIDSPDFHPRPGMANRLTYISALFEISVIGISKSQNR